MEATAAGRDGTLHLGQDRSGRRTVTYILFAAALVAGFWLVRDSTWQGTMALHTLMESIATLLAATVGGMALVRYYARKDVTLLFVGSGFLGTALLDGYHAVVTSSFFAVNFPSGLPSLIPWSWVASRVFLSVLLWLSLVFWKREQRLGPGGWVGEAAVYSWVGFMTVASFLFFAFVPLPRAYYPELLFHRPEEFVPALFFLLALVGYLKKGVWRRDAFEHWLVLSLIVGLIGQAVFMSLSGHLFDMMFDAAHLLKKVSYILVLTGLMIGMFQMFRRPDEHLPTAARPTEAGPTAAGVTGLGELPVGDTRSRRMFRFSLVWLLVVLGIAISIAGFRFVWNWEQEGHVNRMEKTIRSYTASLEETLTRNLDVLHALEAFFASSRFASSMYVDRDEFDTFSARFLNRYSGIQALEWIPRVPAAERRDYEQRARNDGLEDFRFGERNAQGTMVPAAEREEYFPVYYVNPLEGNRRALGFDLGSNPERLAALGKARDSGRITVSAPIRLVQETGDQFGFLTFLPLYRKGLPHDTTERRRRNLAGFVLGVYRVGDVLEGALAKQARPAGVDIYLFDASVPTGPRRIYFHPSRIRKTAVQPAPDDQILAAGYPTVVFPVGGRQWSIVYRQVPGHETQDSTWVPWATLFIGLLFTGFMAVLFTMVFGREARTAALVEERTKDLRDSGARIRAVLENAVDGIITIDSKGVIETFNPAAERTFGYAGDEVVGRNVKLLMPAPFRENHDGYLRNHMETGDKKIIGIGREVVGRRKDGSTFPMDLAVSEMDISGQRMFVGIVRDITERKQVDRMKNEFISTVSHELRTPLTSIQGSLALINKTRPEGLPEKHVRLLDIAHRNCVRLVRLINDILDIEKIESGRIEFRLAALELQPLVDQAIEANQSFAGQFAVSLVLGRDLPGALVHADGDRITQVLTNLLSNAAKFSPEGGTVEVSLSRRDGMIRIEVADRGEGIPEEFRERIFSKFAQADASNIRKRQGTGLGLSIAKAIVDKHGGRIGFDTETGAGTTFFFELPEWRAAGTPPAGTAERRNGFHVLICEDDPDVATLLRTMLAEEGIACDVAPTAARAREMLASGVYSAMILDLMLPDGDGLSLIRELRAGEATRDLPIVVVSARPEAGRQEINGDAVGIVDWLTKPIDRDHLLAAVRRAVSMAGHGRPRILHVEDDADVAEVTAAVPGGGETGQTGGME